MTQGHGGRLGKQEQDTLACWLVESSLIRAAMSSWTNTALFAAAFRRFYEFRVAMLPWFVHVATRGGREREFIRQYFVRYYQDDPANRAIQTSSAYVYTTMIGHFVGAVTYSYNLAFPRPHNAPLQRIY